MGDSLTTMEASELNVAEIGAMSVDLYYDAQILVERIKSYPLVGTTYDKIWKVRYARLDLICYKHEQCGCGTINDTYFIFIIELIMNINYTIYVKNSMGDFSYRLLYNFVIFHFR